MLSAKPIHDRYGDYICRRCINREYRVKLVPEDCHYGYDYECPCCHVMRHIVTGFTLRGRVKMIFR